MFYPVYKKVKTISGFLIKFLVHFLKTIKNPTRSLEKITKHIQF